MVSVRTQACIFCIQLCCSDCWLPVTRSALGSKVRSRYSSHFDREVKLRDFERHYLQWAQFLAGFKPLAKPFEKSTENSIRNCFGKKKWSLQIPFENSSKAGYQHSSSLPRIRSRRVSEGEKERQSCDLVGSCCLDCVQNQCTERTTRSPNTSTVPEHTMLSDLLAHMDTCTCVHFDATKTKKYLEFK